MTTSLYRHFCSGGKLLYVGVSLSAINRLGQHAEHSGWFKSIAKVSIEHFDTREAALEAERAAIVRERPLHNIHHRKAAEEAQKAADAAMLSTVRAKKDLTARIVYFKPVYSLHEAADALSVNVRTVYAWIREKRIGFFTMPNKNGRPVEFISGWQLIEHIESMMTGAAAPEA
jgi:excisionase family DNA binding protein